MIFCVESEDLIKLDWTGITYLQDSSTDICIRGGPNLATWGSPWTRTPGTWAFQYAMHEDPWAGRLEMQYDIQITYMPPRFHLGVAGYSDDSLLEELWRTRPRLHVFGHLHARYGRELLVYDRFQTL